jgi:hypothetical protein
MKCIFVQPFLLFVIFLSFSLSSRAQYLWNNDSAFKAGTTGSGRFWGVMFGDFYIKAHSDKLNRGGNNQYTGIPQDRNSFAFRRIYLGYDYNINSKFSAEILLAAEDDFPAFNPPNSATPGGDQLINNKETFYIKYADLRWKNIWKGTDLIIGEQPTPAFPLLSERIWSYRSIERTIADLRRTNSYDLGIGLQGKFDPKTGNYGYNLLVGNGTSDKPASTGFRWFYGDVYAYFFDKRLVVDLYADYERLNWQPGWHHDRQMTKGFIAYTTPALTIGVEGFLNTIRNDTKATMPGGGADTINTAAQGISLFVHGDLIKNKLRFFVRYDGYTPNHKLDYGKYFSFSGISSPNGYNTPGYQLTYSPGTGAPTAATPTTDISARERFVTLGLDLTPAKGVHLMPNIWYTHYSSQQGAMPDHDLVYRMTFSFQFGK